MFTRTGHHRDVHAVRASAGEPAPVRDIRQWEQVRAMLVFPAVKHRTTSIRTYVRVGPLACDVACSYVLKGWMTPCLIR